jgi:anti-sigma factor RsiW
MLTCRELVEVVTDYLEGALPAGRHAEVVAHLEGCEDCLRYLAQLQATRRVIASVLVQPTRMTGPETVASTERT